MTDALVCGVDIGSTNVKVLLMDGEARTRWVRSIPVPRTADRMGAVTDAKALVQAIEALIVEGWHATGAREPLRAIATTGVGEDGVPVTAELAPLAPAIPWFDRRAHDAAQRLHARVGFDVRSGVPIDFSRTAAKWRWLREQQPAVLPQAHSWLALTDFPVVWWSHVPFISETLAARTGCYDVFARCWIPELLEACGAPPLPPVLPAGTVIGPMAPGALIRSGAASRATVLVSGGHDHPLAASAVRRIDPSALVDSLGTANLMYEEVPAFDPRSDPYLAFSVPARGSPGVACLGVYEFSASLEPFRACDDGRMMRAFLASSSAGSDSSAPQHIARALRHALRFEAWSAQDMNPSGLRAALEASCFYARRMRESIQAAGAARNRIYTVGGWARSRALVELRASVLGSPMTTIAEEELTAVGAALVASDATYPEPIAFHRATHTIWPNVPLQAAYERAYPRIRACLRELHEQERT